MSRNLHVGYGENGFWTYDDSTHIFLKYLIDQAQEYLAHHQFAWLLECIDHWRIQAVVADLGPYLDPNWSGEQRTVVRSLIEQACKCLEATAVIPAQDQALGIFWT